jgi:hypothetical protein
MSTKSGAHLYEILRSATNGGSARPLSPMAVPRPVPAPEPREESTSGGTATLTPPPVFAPPNVEAVVRSPDTAQEPTPLPVRIKVEPTRPRIMLTPMLTPSSPSPMHAPKPAESKAPGDRVLRVTYNTAGFSALVVLAVIFVAYSVGLRGGRTQPAAAAVTVPTTTPPELEPVPGPAVPVTPKSYAIRLMEWPAHTAQELATAKSNAQSSKNSLDRLNFKDARIIQAGDKLMLLYGTYDSRTSDGVKAALEKLKALKLETKDREPRFAKSAGIVEVK